MHFFLGGCPCDKFLFLFSFVALTGSGGFRRCAAMSLMRLRRSGPDSLPLGPDACPPLPQKIPAIRRRRQIVPLRSPASNPAILLLDFF